MMVKRNGSFDRAQRAFDRRSLAIRAQSSVPHLSKIRDYHLITLRIILGGGNRDFKFCKRTAFSSGIVPIDCD